MECWKFLCSHAARWPQCPPLDWSCWVIHNRWLTLYVCEKKKTLQTSTSKFRINQTATPTFGNLKKHIQETHISRYPLYYRWTILMFNISNFSVLIGCFATGPGGINAITHGLQIYPHKTRSMTLLWRLMCLLRLSDLTRCFFLLGSLFSCVIFNS